MSHTKTCLLTVILLTLLYFGARLPFYQQLPIGEEGLFANMFYNHPTAPNYLLLARIEGRDLYYPFNHPSAPCWIISMAGRFFSAFLPPSRAPEAAVIFLVRWAFSLFQFFIFLLLTISLFLRKDGSPPRLATVLPFAVIISPLAVSSSLVLHVDGSVGVLMAGLVSLAWLAKQKGFFSTRMNGLLISSSSFFLGLGKQEWSLAFGAAAIVTLMYTAARRPAGAKSHAYLIYGLAGCLAGNLLGYAIDPVNYLGGISILFLRSNEFRALSWSDPQTVFFILFRLWMLFTLLSLIVVALALLLKNQAGAAWFSFLFAFFLFLGFLPGLFAQGFAFRYYAPALVSITIAVIGLLPAAPGRWLKTTLLLLCALFIANYGLFAYVAARHQLSVTDGFGLPVKAYFPEAAQIAAHAKENNCVPVLPSWMRYRMPAADFVVPSLSREDAEKLVAQHGKSVCSF